MKFEKLILIVGMLSFLAACAGKEDSTDTTESQPTAEAAPAPAPAPKPVIDPTVDREAFVNHMHMHSIHLDRINVALASGDMEAAETPAYWLASHDAIKGLPRGWGEYMAGIRDEAWLIQNAIDIDVARQAAERLAGQCRGCHEANGLEVML